MLRLHSSLEFALIVPISWNALQVKPKQVIQLWELLFLVIIVKGTQLVHDCMEDMHH